MTDLATKLRELRTDFTCEAPKRWGYGWKDYEDAQALRAKGEAARNKVRNLLPQLADVVEESAAAEAFIRTAYESGQSVSPSLFLGVANGLAFKLTALAQAMNTDDTPSPENQGD